MLSEIRTGGRAPDGRSDDEDFGRRWAASDQPMRQARFEMGGVARFEIIGLAGEGEREFSRQNINPLLTVVTIVFRAFTGGGNFDAQGLEVKKAAGIGEGGIFQAVDGLLHRVGGPHDDTGYFGSGRFEKRGQRDIENAGKGKRRGNGSLATAGFEAGQKCPGQCAPGREFLQGPPAPQAQFPQPRPKGSELRLYLITSLMPLR